MSEEMSYREILDEILASERLDDRARRRALVLHEQMRQNITLGLGQMDWLNATLKRVRKPILCHYLEDDGGCLFKGRNRFFKDRGDTNCNLVATPRQCEFFREKKGGTGDDDDDS